MACKKALMSACLLRNSRTFSVMARQTGTFLHRANVLAQPKMMPQSRVIPPMVSHFHTSTSRMNQHVITIQDEKDFDAKVLKNSTPVIVDFFATWCGPCKLLIPRLESLVAGKDGKVILAKIDIDEMTDLAVTYGVEAVPTVIGMKNGKVIDKFVGLKDDAALETFVEKLTK